jgi:hypothetical protein
MPNCDRAPDALLVASPAKEIDKKQYLKAMVRKVLLPRNLRSWRSSVTKGMPLASRINPK